MSRGRPTEEAVIRTKYVQTCYEVPNKPEIGYKSVHYFDLDKFSNGAYRVDHFPSKDEKPSLVKAEKGKAYNKQPVVMVFRTSNRSNAKTKMKVWRNENIDWIITQDKLAGVPSNAEILELGVGASFIEEYKSKYKLK